MRYTPLTDEELEKAVLTAIDTALEGLDGLDVPKGLYEQIEATIESWEGWEQEVLEADYCLYEDYVDSTRGDRI